MNICFEQILSTLHWDLPPAETEQIFAMSSLEASSSSRPFFASLETDLFCIASGKFARNLTRMGYL